MPGTGGAPDARGPDDFFAPSSIGAERSLVTAFFKFAPPLMSEKSAFYVPVSSRSSPPCGWHGLLCLWLFWLEAVLAYSMLVEEEAVAAGARQLFLAEVVAAEVEVEDPAS